MREGEFISWLEEQEPDLAGLPSGSGQKDEIGIGDDSAFIHLKSRDCLIATDMILEGVHFSADTEPQLIGRKALAINLSDIAAMGGVPFGYVIALALHASRDLDYGKAIISGAHNLGREFGARLVGGDTNSWKGKTVLNITIYGHPYSKSPITRGGARPGDSVFVTNFLGGSEQGHHLRFTPRLREAHALLDKVSITAMTDISDGLSKDLMHILQKSKVGARLYRECLPEAPSLAGLPRDQQLSRLLTTGEDFELCFTVSREDGERLTAKNPLKIPLTHIGEIVAEPGCSLWDRGTGTFEKVTPKGYEHGF